jgi:two-component system, LytTR family, response regulator
VIRAIIADDEPLARERLRTLLAAEADVALVAECGDGLETADALARHRPDVLFLDVQMPEVDGFRLLEGLPADGAPLVVFVTAYPQYALRAFDAAAADYLLKPFDRERFARTMQRVRERLRGGPRLRDELATLLDQLRARPSSARDHIPVRSGQRTVLVRVEEIDWIESSGNYVTLHVGDQEHLLRETLSELEAQLSPRQFVRVHRTAIVNLDRIQSLTPTPHGDHRLKLRNGRELTLSRTYRARLEQLLGRSL